MLDTQLCVGDKNKNQYYDLFAYGNRDYERDKYYPNTATDP